MAATRHKRVEVVLKTSRGPYPLPVRFARRRGFRHLKVSVNLYNEVVVNVPAYVADRYALSFLQKQADWIYDLLRRTPGTPSIPEMLAHRPFISGAGREWAVDLCLAPRVRCELNVPEGIVRFKYSSSLELETQTLGGLRAFARHVIPERVTLLARSVGVDYKNISVRDQRSRWGSCSARGTLSFNWRLVMLPFALHDYIIWHELAHLTHLNHSPAFWGLLSSYDPHYKEHDIGVSDWSARLMRLGRNTSPARAEFVRIDA